MGTTRNALCVVEVSGVVFVVTVIAKSFRQIE